MNGTHTSPRQREILRLLDEGMIAEEIADALGISLSTVRTITKRLLRRWPGRIPDLPAKARADGVRF